MVLWFKTLFLHYMSKKQKEGKMNFNTFHTVLFRLPIRSTCLLLNNSIFYLSSFIWCKDALDMLVMIPCM